MRTWIVSVKPSPEEEGFIARKDRAGLYELRARTLGASVIARLGDRYPLADAGDTYNPVKAPAIPDGGVRVRRLVGVGQLIVHTNIEGVDAFLREDPEAPQVFDGAAEVFAAMDHRSIQTTEEESRHLLGAEMSSAQELRAEKARITQRLAEIDAELAGLATKIESAAAQRSATLERS